VKRVFFRDFLICGTNVLTGGVRFMVVTQAYSKGNLGALRRSMLRWVEQEAVGTPEYLEIIADDAAGAFSDYFDGVSCGDNS